MPDLPGVVRLRDRKEALTLRTILATARRLFAERGYRGTPIRTIAQQAGVAPQTIYAHFGSKAGVLTGLMDLLDDESGLPDLIADSETVADASDLLCLMARASRRIRERCGDILAIVGSGTVDGADVDAARLEGARRNRLGIDLVLRHIEVCGGELVPGAVDIAAAMMSQSVHDSLITEGGWSYDDYERWLAETLVKTVLK